MLFNSILKRLSRGDIFMWFLKQPGMARIFLFTKAYPILPHKTGLSKDI